MQTFKEIVKNMRPWRAIFERLYERRFAYEARGCFRGAFSSFATAKLSAPRTKPQGFDHADCAREFEERRTRIFSFDYPMLFWLLQLLRQNCVIFDYGGHVGTHFYAYRKYLDYPLGLRWIVCDLPAIVDAGQELARAREALDLQFTNRFVDADGSDILIAAGSLQYIEKPSFSELLRTLKRPPSHLLLNKLPLYDGIEFVTLQNGGTAFHPQYVFNRRDFVESLQSLGYRLKDEWTVETHPGYLPFHPEKSFANHCGMYLELHEPNYTGSH